MDLSWLLALVIGTGTALVELLSRYRDEPFKVIAQSHFAWVYMSLNGCLALAAHWVLLTSEWGVDASNIDRAGLAVSAGLGAAVILRSRVFTAQLGDEQVSIGPGYVVDQLLTIIDAQIDRRRALQRVQIVIEAMDAKDFEKAKTFASTMITGSRQNLTLQEQKDLAAQIREVQDRRISDQEKSYALGFILLDFMGEEFLDEITRRLPKVEVLGDSLDGEPASQLPASITATATNKHDLDAVPARRVRNESRSVARANLVNELLTGVPVDRVLERVVDLLDSEVLGSNPAERAGLRIELKDIMARTSDKPQDKVYALGFLALKASDADFFNEAFGRLRLSQPLQAVPNSDEDESEAEAPDAP
ncbi:hypothetical protein ACNOYE_28745 [Nannocystaceae bacterium ST9]